MVAKATELAISYVPKVAGAIFLWVVGFWIINRLTAFIHSAMEGREFDVSLRTFLRSLISISLKVLLLFSIAGMLGIETTSFVTILGAAGLAVGLALQGSLSNFAGGVLILTFKPFKVGDVIDAQSKIGKVQEIQIFNTVLLTPDNKSVIIPNGPLSNGTIVNITKEGMLEFEILLDLSNKNNFTNLRSIIENLLLEDSRISNGRVGVKKIGVNLTLFVKGTTQSEICAAVANEMTTLIYIELQKHKIEFSINPIG